MPTFKEQARIAKNRARLYFRSEQTLPALAAMGLVYTGLRTLPPLAAAALSVPAASIYSSLSHMREKPKKLKKRTFKLARLLPFVDKEIQNELLKTFAEIEHEEFTAREAEGHITVLPEEGLPPQDLLGMVANTHQHIKDPTRISGGLYTDFQNEAVTGPKVALYKEVALTNPMHDDLWPILRRLETDAIAMCLELYAAPETGYGVKTAGGTLSIFMACIAARRRAEDFFLPVTAPSIVVSERAHPAFKKACDFLGIELITIPTDPITFKMDLKALDKSITPNTILVVANGPAFPEGIIDDVEGVAKTAGDYGIPCMVDCCLGGFLLPFCEKAGIEIPAVNFSVENVWMISADTHKFGGAEKGNSVLLFRDYDAMGKYVGFADLTSMIGLYASVSLEGSRPTKLDDWLSMLSHGFEGYVKNLSEMIALKNTICDGIKTIEGIHVSGDPKLPIFAIRADDPSKINALLIASKMKEKNWIINGLPNPPGFHFCLTPANLVNKNFAEEFLSDLKEATAYATSHPKEKPRGTLGMYDTLRNKIPPAVLDIFADEIADAYLHTINSTERKFTSKDGALLPAYQALCKAKKKDVEPENAPRAFVDEQLGEGLLRQRKSRLKNT